MKKSVFALPLFVILVVVLLASTHLAYRAESEIYEEGRNGQRCAAPSLVRCILSSHL
jgi:hypothetical protein